MFRIFVFCVILICPFSLARAEDAAPRPGETPTLDANPEQEKIDQVIQDAKKALDTAEPTVSVKSSDKPSHAHISASSANTKLIGKKVGTTPVLTQPKRAAGNATKTPSISKTAKVVPKPSLPAKKTSVVTKKLPPPKPLGSTGPLTAFELGRYQYCGQDKDCVAAVNGCCDCANGSEDVAVNGERLTAFRARFSCLYVACGEKSQEPACGTGIVSCVNHRCRYFTDAPTDQAF